MIICVYILEYYYNTIALCLVRLDMDVDNERQSVARTQKFHV